MRGKMLVIWKLLARPLRLMISGSNPAMLSPCKSMRPELTPKRPLIRLNSVDLPAPFGPMMAWRSPGLMLRLTPLMIDVRPKLLRTSCNCRAGAVMISNRSLLLQLDRKVFPGVRNDFPDEINQGNAHREHDRNADPVLDLHGVELQAEIRERLAGCFLGFEVVDHFDQREKPGQHERACDRRDDVGRHE